MPSIKIPRIPASEITDESVWKQRRQLLQLAMAAPLLWAERGLAGSSVPEREAAASDPDLDLLDDSKKIPNVTPSVLSTDETPTPYRYVSTYNNYLELGSGKASPAENAADLTTEPWTVTVGGECEAPGMLDMDKVFKLFPQEERIYRLRCVEAWAMVVPWVGFPLGDLLKRFKPTSKAKYVEFETLFDPKRLTGQRRLSLPWPYKEGLRMDEAMHPLTIIGTGVYGRVLPNQNGAPLRLVVPWKYGFKSIKSIVRINFTETEPSTTWSDMQPEEYGFYANVNPAVSHPRWSQKHHRIIGEGLFSGRHPTLPFNGYAEQVASLYAGMDLKKRY